MRLLLALSFLLISWTHSFAENPQKARVDRYAKAAAALLEMEPQAPVDGNYCMHDGFCEVSFDNFKLVAQFYGPYQSNILTSSVAAPEQYLLACSALVKAVAEVHEDLAIAAVLETFKFAKTNGNGRSQVGGAELTVKPDGSLLECNMFRK